MPQTAPSHEHVIVVTRHWIEQAVIGLDLCPFAKGVHAREQIRYVLSVGTGALPGEWK